MKITITLKSKNKVTKLVDPKPFVAVNSKGREVERFTTYRAAMEWMKENAKKGWVLYLEEMFEYQVTNKKGTRLIQTFMTHKEAVEFLMSEGKSGWMIKPTRLDRTQEWDVADVSQYFNGGKA